MKSTAATAATGARVVRMHVWGLTRDLLTRIYHLYLKRAEQLLTAIRII
ncbi:MAG: hypothetical protein KF860_12040 [Cyclobacteriaceae bacterium]|nr:hypothetical protein [Cyclobacteriaceae bacterium]